MPPITLAIVDDHVLFRKMLKNYLCDRNGVSIPIQTSDIFDLLNQLKTTSVDVLIMDLFMPGLNVHEAVKTIRAGYPGIKILILSMFTDVGLISDLLDLGIYGYVSKLDEPDELLRAIQTIATKQVHRNRLLTETLYRNSQNNIKAYKNTSQATLSDREKKILQLMWEEKSTREIANELYLGVRSVEKIRQDIKEKLGVKSMVGLLKYAIDKRIVGVQSLGL